MSRLVLLALAGCTWSRMESQDLCTETADIVAYRTWSCTLDEELAADRREAWLTDVGCDHRSAPMIELFECVDAISDATCDQIIAKGDDFAEWIELSEVCPHYLTVENP